MIYLLLEKNLRYRSSAIITWSNTTWYCIQYSSYWAVNRNLCTQQTPHTSPSRASYGVSLVRNLENIDNVITAPHCIWTMLHNDFQRPVQIVSKDGSLGLPDLNLGWNWHVCHAAVVFQGNLLHNSKKTTFLAWATPVHSHGPIHQAKREYWALICKLDISENHLLAYVNKSKLIYF